MVAAPAKLPDVDSPPPVEAVSAVSALSPPVSADPRALPAPYRIASVGARTDDPRAALQIILLELTGLFHATCGSIALLSPDTGRLEIEIQQGLPPDCAATGLRLGQGITGWVAFHGRAQLVPDVAADPRYILLRADVRCEMAVPMEANGQIIGVINLDSDRLGGFSGADLALLE